MQAASLRQEYYGLFPQSNVYRKETRAAEPGTSGSHQSLLPAVRVVEGEVIRNRNSSAGYSMDPLVQHGRNTKSEDNFPGATVSNPAARRAINAYLDNTAASALSGGRSFSVDFYA